MKRTLHIAMSLDGYIADPNGSIAWLENASRNPEVLARIAPFIAATEVLIMGRLTYEQVLTFGEWPYASQTCIVVSSRDLQPKTPDTTVVQVEDLFAAMVATGKHNIWIVGGGQLNAYMLAHHLVDEMVVTVAPVLLGDGVKLFSQLPGEVSLRLREMHPLVDGFVELTYEFPRPC